MVSKAQAPYPFMAINGEFLSKDFLIGVQQELLAKAALWQAGIDTPTQADRLAYFVLKQISFNNWGVALPEDR